MSIRKSDRLTWTRRDFVRTGLVPRESEYPT